MAQATWTTQEIGADQLLVKVNVDASGIEDELKKHLDETRRTAQIDGFRKGKAPDSVLMRCLRHRHQRHRPPQSRPLRPAQECLRQLQCSRN